MDLRQGFQLGEWSVRPLTGELIGARGSRHLQPKAMDVLLKLVERAPNVVERHQLVSDVWGERAVSDEPLTRCIAELRRQLGDRKGEPHYIETIPKRGYRLLISGEPADDAAVSGQRTNGPAGAAKELAVPDRSLAVMPFIDLSPGRDQNFFAEGIADEIATTLANLPDLKVAARTSSFKLRDEDHASVRRLLGVRFVLEGSVRRIEDRVRVNFRLIDTADGFQRLAQNLEKYGQDILKIQEDVARHVFECLPKALLAQTPPNWSQRSASSIEVNDLYLRGLHKFNARNLDEATGYLQRACALDPCFAPAHATYAQALATLPLVYPIDEPSKIREEAKRMALRALELDPESAQAYAALAAVHWGSYAWKDAERELLRAIEIGPRDATVRHRYGMHHLFTGRLSTAQEQLEIARQLDPLSGAIARELGVVLHMRGDVARAEQLYRDTRLHLDTDRKLVGISALLGMLLLEHGRYQEAHAELGSDIYLQDVPADLLSALVDAVASYRSSGKVVELPPEIESRIPALAVAARLYTLAGNHERALACISRGFQLGDPWVLGFAVDAAYQELRTLPKGRNLLRSMGRDWLETVRVRSAENT